MVLAKVKEQDGIMLVKVPSIPTSVVRIKEGTQSDEVIDGCKRYGKRIPHLLQVIAAVADVGILGTFTFSSIIPSCSFTFASTIPSCSFPLFIHFCKRHPNTFQVFFIKTFLLYAFYKCMCVYCFLQKIIVVFVGLGSDGWCAERCWTSVPGSWY